jgi:hypothetical protein
MKRTDTPVDVIVQSARPIRITWNGKHLAVQEIIDFWVYQTRWWRPRGDERRVYYRLRTAEGTVELYRSDDEWVLSRIAD